MDEAWVRCSRGGRVEATTLARCRSRLHMASLGYNNIGDAGARDLGAALRVNTTLTELK